MRFLWNLKQCKSQISAGGIQIMRNSKRFAILVPLVSIVSALAARDPTIATDRDVIVYRISGAFFFGAAANVAATRTLATAQVIKP